jgi:ribonuclease H / adenosylcobalamin/alpha-ribazole phosphatase
MLSTLAALLFFTVPDPLAALGPVPPGTVRVYLVRHGQALSNLDPPPKVAPHGLDHLTPLGEAQVRKAGEVLAGRGVKLVLSSPAGRARESAEKIAAAIGAAPVRVESRLRPLDLGNDSSGKPLSWDDREAEWTAGRDPSPPGGESMAQMGRRVMEVVKGLRRDAPGTSVVLVAHSEVVGAFVGEVQGTPAATRFPPRIANASVTVVEAHPDGTVALLFANHVAPGMPTPAP